MYNEYLTLALHVINSFLTTIHRLWPARQTHLWFPDMYVSPLPFKPL